MQGTELRGWAGFGSSVPCEPQGRGVDFVEREEATVLPDSSIPSQGLSISGLENWRAGGECWKEHCRAEHQLSDGNEIDSLSHCVRSVVPQGPCPEGPSLGLLLCS